MFLPERIRNLLADEKWETDHTGMSAASVFLCGDRVLKVSECGEEAENEFRMLQYLQDKLPVPRIYAHETAENRSYLLMDRCAGSMACSRDYRNSPGTLCKLLANGLKRLWAVDIADCPSDQRLSHKLAQAEYYVENGLVDMENVEPDTFGGKGFKDPGELLRWLYENRPEEEPVLSHGDYCLPNIFGVQQEVIGYIDLGRAGIADKWCDIALCYRSLSHNYDGKYQNSGENTYPDCDLESSG